MKGKRLLPLMPLLKAIIHTVIGHTAQCNRPHNLNEQLHCQPEHNYLQTIEQEIIQVVI